MIFEIKNQRNKLPIKAIKLSDTKHSSKHFIRNASIEMLLTYKLRFKLSYFK